MNTLRTFSWRRVVSTCLALALALGGCANPPQQRGESASIVLAGIVVDGSRLAGERDTGLVRIWRDGRSIEAHSGMRLLRGDFIEAGGQADAVIRFPNGSTLYMRPDSRGRIGSLSEAVGEFFARIKGAFSIESSFVRAAANGTSFLVRANAEGETSVSVLEGSVFVDSTRGAWQRILVHAGQAVVAQAHAAPVTSADQQDLRQTQEWADRLDRLLPPAESSASSGGSSVAGAIAVGAAIAAGAVLLSSRDKDDAPHGSRTDPYRSPGAADLAAPSARGIGSADAGRAPSVACNRRVGLAWGSVRGAREHVVTLQSRISIRAPWITTLTEATTQQSIEVAAEAGRAYRWFVQARDASRVGPASSALYFTCASIPR
ncbi:MAG: FecR family protein [Ideonella sp.]